MDCEACRNPIEDDSLIGCVGCKNTYHYECCNMRKEIYQQEYVLRQRKWFCPSCTNITRRRNDNTPVRKYNLHSPPEHSADISSMTIMSCDDEGPHVSQQLRSSDTQKSGAMLKQVSGVPPTAITIQPPTNKAVTIEEFEAMLDRKLDMFKKAIAQEVHSMVMKDVACTISSLEKDFTDTTDYLQRGQDDLIKELELASGRIKALELERSALQSDIASLDRRLVTIEKTSRSHNLEIHMVPEKRNENVLNIIKKLHETVNLAVEAGNICSVRRVAKLDPKSERPRNILVTLQSERLRDNLLSAVRRYNKANRSNTLSSLHLGVEGERRSIYVAEHLSPTTKKLHAETRKYAKDKGYKYVWVKYERIYVRKDDNGSAIHIKNSNDLNKLT